MSSAKKWKVHTCTCTLYSVICINFVCKIFVRNFCVTLLIFRTYRSRVIYSLYRFVQVNCLRKKFSALCTKWKFLTTKYLRIMTCMYIQVSWWGLKTIFLPCTYVGSIVFSMDACSLLLPTSSQDWTSYVSYMYMYMYMDMDMDLFIVR
jgi:hypothetical protein